MDVSEEDDIDKELFNMALIVPEQSQRPYRFGMTLLCIGALFNWMGLADSYTEPVPAVRYIGVGLIAVGAALICLAMCCWMRAVQDPQYAREVHNRENVAVQVINMEEPDPRSLEKPPDYSSVVDFPPSYEDAIKELDANKLLYACPINNNNYEDAIKTIEETVLIINQLEGATDIVGVHGDANKTEQEIKEISCVQIKETDKPVEAHNGNENINATHHIIEIPASEEKLCSQASGVSIVHTHSVNESKNSAYLVPNETSKSNSLSNVLRKSFRSLRKSATLPSSTPEESSNCDNGSSSGTNR